ATWMYRKKYAASQPDCSPVYELLPNADVKGMSASLKKFVSRAPRYTLRPNDNHFMRFAHKEDSGHVYTTRFVDISLTGLAFITDRENAPFIYDMIKIEIPLPGGQQVAWWAKVVRIEEYNPQK